MSAMCCSLTLASSAGFEGLARMCSSGIRNIPAGVDLSAMCFSLASSAGFERQAKKSTSGTYVLTDSNACFVVLGV